MADGRKYFVLCGDNCKFESMTKEQILTAIEQAVSTGEIKDVDSGFITKIKELNKGEAITFWRGTTAEYNALTERFDDCIYIKTDDIDIEALDGEIAGMHEEIRTINEEIANANKRLENLKVDFIVEQGVIDGWTYKKWDSGTVECWGAFSMSAKQVGSNTETITLPCKKFVYEEPDPFVHTECLFTEPDFNVQITCGHNGSVVTQFGDYNSNGSVEHYADGLEGHFEFTYTLTKSHAVTFNFYVIGR